MVSTQTIAGRASRHRARRMSGLVCLCVAALVMAGIGTAPTAQAAGDLVITVSVAADGHQVGTLRNAFDQANSGSWTSVTITVPATTMTLSLCGSQWDDTNVAGDLDYTNSAPLHVIGLGAGATVVQTCQDRILEVHTGTASTLQSLTVKGGRLTGVPALGGGVRTDGRLALQSVTMTDNRADGLCDAAGSASGGAVSAVGDVTATASHFTDNVATGASISVYSDPICFIPAAGDAHGGAIAAASVDVDHSTFDGNKANGGSTSPFGQGGGILGSPGRSFGGAIDASGKATVDATTFHGNEAYAYPLYGDSRGGAVNASTIAASFVTADENEAVTGGVLAASGDASTTNSTFTHNLAYRTGGAVSSDGLATVLDSTFRDNRAEGVTRFAVQNVPPVRGGALVGAVGVDVQRSWFDRNEAKATTAVTYVGPINSGPAQGGAIGSNGNITLTRSSFTDNSAVSGLTDAGAPFFPPPDPARGGVVYSGNGVVMLSNSTVHGAISRRVPPPPGYVGGSGPQEGAVAYAPHVQLGNATVTGIDGTSAFHVDRFDALSSVVEKPSGDTCASAGQLTTFSAGNNFFGDATCQLSQASDHQTAVPLWLGAPGSPTPGSPPVRVPAPFSPVVDLASAPCPTSIDQRGVSRPQGTGCDSGAVDVAAGPAPPVDASATVTAEADPVAQNTTAVYHVTVSNNGGGTLPVDGVLQVPDGVTPEEVTSPTASCFRTVSQARCTGTVAPTESYTFSVTARVEVFDAFDVSVDTDVPSDSNPANDGQTLTTHVVIVADLALETSFDGMMIVNHGPSDRPPIPGQSNIHMKAVVPPGASVYFDAPTGWTSCDIDPPANERTCQQTALLPAGGEAHLSVIFQPATSRLPDGTFEGTLTSGPTDPDQSNQHLVLTTSYAAPEFHPIAPRRLADTREGNPRGRLGSAETMKVQATGDLAGAGALVLNVTAVNPSADTFITAYGKHESQPYASNLNIATGDTRANVVVVNGDEVSLFNNTGFVDLVVDVVGVYSAAGSPQNDTGLPFHVLPPDRLFDTRNGTGVPAGKIGAGQTLNVPIAGRAGVPASGAQAVMVNLTGIGPSAATHVTAWAGGGSMPATSNVNLPAGDTRAANVIVPIGGDGSINLFNNAGTIDLAADVVGWYGPDNGIGGGLHLGQQHRLVDTRYGSPYHRLGPGEVLELPVEPYTLGSPFITPQAAILNVTGVQASGYTHVTAWGDGSAPNTSVINLRPGETVANFVVVPLGAESKLRFRNNAGSLDLVVDVAGYID